MVVLYSPGETFSKHYLKCGNILSRLAKQDMTTHNKTTRASRHNDDEVNVNIRCS